MIAEDCPKFEPGALEILSTLSEPGMRVVIETLDVGEDIIYRADILQAIKSCGGNVRGVMELVHPHMRKMITIESTPSDGKVRRTIDDVMRGVRSCAYCLRLGNEVLGKS